MADASPCNPRRRTFHGRRKGRRLRPGRQRLLDELLPQLEIRLPPPGEPLDPHALFEPPRPDLWLEIGFGAGEHLAWQAREQAKRDSPVGLIGVEFFINGIASLLHRIDGTPALERLRLYRGDARDLLDQLPGGCLQRVFILFPDPWPKLRHHKRRLIRRETLGRLSRVMAAGAELRIATDDDGYLTWILERLAGHPRFRWLADGPRDWRVRPADWPATRYEEKALAAGRTPAYLRFRRCREGPRRALV